MMSLKRLTLQRNISSTVQNINTPTEYSEEAVIYTPPFRSFLTENNRKLKLYAKQRNVSENSSPGRAFKLCHFCFGGKIYFLSFPGCPKTPLFQCSSERYFERISFRHWTWTSISHHRIHLGTLKTKNGPVKQMKDGKNKSYGNSVVQHRENADGGWSLECS